MQFDKANEVSIALSAGKGAFCIVGFEHNVFTCFNLQKSSLLIKWPRYKRIYLPTLHSQIRMPISPDMLQ